jgi:hypothetical protein
MSIERFEVGRVKNLKEENRDYIDIPEGGKYFIFELEPASNGMYGDGRYFMCVGDGFVITDEFKEGDEVLLLFDVEYDCDGGESYTLVRLLNLTKCQERREISPVLAVRKLVELREVAKKADAALEEQLKNVAAGAMQKRDPHAVIGTCPLCHLPIYEDDEWTEGEELTHKECPVDVDDPGFDDEGGMQP